MVQRRHSEAKFFSVARSVLFTQLGVADVLDADVMADGQGGTESPRQLLLIDRKADFLAAARAKVK